MKRKQFIIIVLALMLSGPSLQASTQTFSENTSVTNPPTSNAMFDVDTSTSQVSNEIKAVSDEVDSLLDNAAAPAEPKKEETPAKMVDRTVESGDSLWRIAQELLGDGNRYREIIEANKDKYPSLVKNPDLIYAGWVLKVPVKPAETAEATPAAGNSTTTPQPETTKPEVTIDNSSGNSAANVANVPQWSVQERVKRLQNALDSANRALLAQKKRIADLNPQTIRFLIDNKFMTEEEWMGMNPPEGYVYRLDKVGKVELVGSDNKPLSNADMAKLDQKSTSSASAPAATGTTATGKTGQETKGKSEDEKMAEADAKAKQDAYNKLSAEEKARKDKAEKEKQEKLAKDKAAADKAAADKAAAEKLAKEKAAAAEKAAEEAAKNKYQQIISSMGMPDLADNTKGYLDAMKKGAKLIDRGFLKSNSFDKFCYPYDYPMYNIVELQQMLRSAQQHYEKMVDKNRTSRVLGIFGDTIESAGKKVDQAKSRLEKAWGELKKSLDEAKTKSQELEKEVSGNKTRIDAANKELSKLDQYDTSNASQVQKLKKEIKDLTEKNSDAQKKLDGYQTLKSTFKL